MNKLKAHGEGYKLNNALLIHTKHPPSSQSS